MIDVTRVREIAETQMEGTDLFVVEVRVSPANEIVVTVDSDTQVGIDRCVELSRSIEGALDREQEDFELTVSSAGIGYPFKVEQQYQKNLGKSVEIKLNDHTKLNGILLRFTPEEIVIEQEEKKIIEGSKRKQLVKTERTIVRKDIKEIKDVVKF